MFNPFLSVASRNLTTHAIVHLSQSDREGAREDTHEADLEIARVSNLACDKFLLVENSQSDAENNKA